MKKQQFKDDIKTYGIKAFEKWRGQNFSMSPAIMFKNNKAVLNAFKNWDNQLIKRIEL